jgi:Family of unknown function (DUF6526)
MAEKIPQTFANHVRFDPLFHFFTLPVFALAVIWSIVHLIRHPSWHAGGLFVLLAAAATAVLKTRLYALRVQDRVIRLEERLRLSTALSEPLRSRIPELTEDQLIGLRFCCDAELPVAVERVLSQKLKRAEIKKGIQTWRPDYWRV